MNIGNVVKKMAIERGTTLTNLAKSIAEKKGKDYSIQNLSAKLKKGTINFIELETIMETLGYSIEFQSTK